MKDISQYIDFTQNEGRYPKRSVRSLINLPCTVHEWTELESRFRDGNPSGRYVQMHVELEAGHFLVNTGSAIIMEQLDQISKAKQETGETDQGFTCIVKRAGRGVKLYPMDWKRKDVSTQARKEGEQDGRSDEGN